MENWKLIDDFPKYEVSDLGDVRNVRTGRVLKERLDKDGYDVVYLYGETKPQNRRVSRLVSEAFIGEIPERHDVNHKNGVKTDDRAVNLEITTHSENLDHAYVTGLHSAQIGVIHLETGDVYRSMSEASRNLGVSVPYISEDANHKRKNRTSPTFEKIGG